MTDNDYHSTNLDELYKFGNDDFKNLLRNRMTNFLLYETPWDSLFKNYIFYSYCSNNEIVPSEITDKIICDFCNGILPIKTQTYLEIKRTIILIIEHGRKSNDVVYNTIFNTITRYFNGNIKRYSKIYNDPNYNPDNVHISFILGKIFGKCYKIESIKNIDFDIKKSLRINLVAWKCSSFSTKTRYETAFYKLFNKLKNLQNIKNNGYISRFIESGLFNGLQIDKSICNSLIEEFYN